LRAFAPLLKSAAVERIAHADSGLRMDCKNVREALAGTPLQRPPDNLQAWQAHFSYLQRIGFLEAPR